MNAQATGNEMHTKEQLQRIAADAATEPPPERPLSKTEMIEVLTPWFIEMKGRGHTIDSIVATYLKKKIHLSARAVSKALAAASTANSKRGRKPKSTTPAGSLPEDVQ